MLEYIYIEGKKAYANGDMRAPAANSLVYNALGSLPVGNPRSIEIMSSFTAGFDAAADEYCAEMGL